MKLIDTHCHIYGDAYKDDIDKVLKSAEKACELIVNIGYDLNTSKITDKMTKENDFIFGTVGYHPTEIKDYSDKIKEELKKIAQNNNKIVAIGEIGLDYHWMNDSKEDQEKAFRDQMELAKELDLPVVIHTRDAMEDTINILNDYPEVSGIIHCYPGSYESAKLLMDRYYFGINGVVTFKNNKSTKEFVKKIPIEKLVVETDAPYLTPTPFRGKRNIPDYCRYVVEEIAKIKGLTFEEVLKITNENAKKVYRLK